MIGKPDQIAAYLWQLEKDKDYVFEIKEYKQKRSLNANAYCWVLINKIANILRKSKEEVYLQMLIDYGQSEMVSILSSIDVKGYFKYFTEAGRSVLNGKEFTHYKIYKGSSEYDTREMAILIDGIVSECKELDIETMTPAELQSLKESWRG